MSLSGAIQKNVNSHWALRLEWSATQNISANTSTITAKLYWMGTDQYGTTYTTATKDGGVYIEGTWSYFSGAGLAKLTGSEKKLIHTYTKTITHNSDGTLPNITFDAYFDAELDISGYVGRIDLDAQDWDLNTIPRKSTLSDTTPTFTAGGDFTINISPASSNFSHKAYIDMQDSALAWHNIKEVNFASGDKSQSSAFSSTDKTNIFNWLNGRSSARIRINLYTYNSATVGTNSLGYNGYETADGITAPLASTGVIANPTNVSETSGQEGSTVWIDQVITVNLTTHDSEFNHKIYFKDANGGSNVHIGTLVAGDISYSWTPTQAEKDLLYNKIPNGIEFDGDVTIETFYGTEIVRSYTSLDINYRVRNSNPTFTGEFTYTDTNTKSSGVTGDPLKIVQGVSNVKVTLPFGKRATSNNKATMVSYSASLGGKTVTAVWSATVDVTFDFGAIDASNNQTLTITAIDSRGNKTAKSITVTMVAYKTPQIVSTALRVNDFESNTTLNVSGTIYAVGTNDLVTNADVSLTGLKYRYRQKGVTTWGAYYAFTWSKPSATAFTGDPATRGFDNTKAWEIEIVATDKLGSSSVIKTVNAGMPLFFIDATKESVSIGMMPTKTNAVEINTGVDSTNGGVHFQGTNVSGKIWTGTGGIVLQSEGTANLHLGANNTSDMVFYPDRIQVGSKTLTLPANRFGTLGGAIDGNNSDFIKLNGLYFGQGGSDLADNQGEGLLFPKSTTPNDTYVTTEWNNFRVDANGVAMINGVPISVNPSATTLWSGANYMSEATTQVVTPSKKLSECANGWIICWSDFDPATPAYNDADMSLSFIHKKYVANFVGKWMPFVIPSYTTKMVIKYLGVYDDKLTGHANNDATAGVGELDAPNEVVLRRVWEW